MLQRSLFWAIAIVAVATKAAVEVPRGWSMIGFDATHNGRGHLLPPALLGSPHVKWSFRGPGEIESSAVVSDDETLVFSAAGNQIFALNAADGSKHSTLMGGGCTQSLRRIGVQVWGFEAKAQVLASPALADGALYIGADDNTFYALEQKSGALRWKHNAGGEFTGGAISTGGRVFVGCGKPALLAFDTSGKLLWEHICASNVASTPAADSELVYFGDDSGAFYALEQITGEERWSLTLENGCRGPAAVHDEVLYISTGDPDSSQSGEVLKVSKATGEVLWKSECNGGHHKCDSCWTTPTLVHSVLVVGCGLDSIPRGKLWGLSELDGSVVWSRDMEHDMQTSSPVKQRDGSVLIGSVDGHLYSVDASTGELLWSFEAGSFGHGVWATPAVASDGTVYVGSHSEHLYALGGSATSLKQEATSLKQEATSRKQEL